MMIDNDHPTTWTANKKNNSDHHERPEIDIADGYDHAMIANSDLSVARKPRARK